MKLKKITSLLLMSLFALTGLVSVASAEDVAVGASLNTNVKLNDDSNDIDDNDDIDDDANKNATSTWAKNNRATSTAEFNAESHRSEVAVFVRSLLNIANREGGIGAQVRLIAQSQQDSASTSVKAITKVEKKSKLGHFFFGTDYKSVGQLRSEMVVTQNNIDKLKTLLAQATNASTKAELSAQIKVLEDSQIKMDAFIEKHEDSFSLFGWFSKWISE